MILVVGATGRLGGLIARTLLQEASRYAFWCGPARRMTLSLPPAHSR